MRDIFIVIEKEMGLISDITIVFWNNKRTKVKKINLKDYVKSICAGLSITPAYY